MKLMKLLGNFVSSHFEPANLPIFYAWQMTVELMHETRRKLEYINTLANSNLLLGGKVFLCIHQNHSYRISHAPENL